MKRIVMSVVLKLGRVVFTSATTEKRGAGQSCSVRLSVYLCSVNKGKYCIW